MNRRVPIAAAVMATVLPAFVAGASQEQGGTVRIDFEAAATGAPPPSFTAALTGKGGPVEWVVLEDQSAPAGPKVLAETSRDQTSDRFPLAILDRFTAKNVDISVRFKPVAGRVDQAAGLMVRVRDANNYYIARANALEDNVRLYKVVNGHRQQFAGKNIEVPQGTWQTLGLIAEENRFAVMLNGEVLFTATDDTFASPGRVGLWTKADSVTHFDDLAVRALP